ncbi:MAG TPA: DUF5686 family protein, partial [Flavitalea sp.]|nr:DUF5686 family protein [Flavitalea sp.]
MKVLHKKPAILAFGLVVFSYSIEAQTLIRGIVKDADSPNAMPFVSIYFAGHKGVISDSEGRYSLSTNNLHLTVVEYSYAGYKTVSKKIIPGKEQEVNINLEILAMKEVVFSSNKRGKYRNRNNPAVELIRKVIDHKKTNRISSYPYVEYQQYEKMQLSITNKPEKLLKKKLLKNYKFFLENQDTTKLEGKSLLPIYLNEKLSQKYIRKDPGKEKTYILGEKKVNYGDHVDNEGVSTYLNRMYADIDVYENNIIILNNHFLSPIADASPSFYRFYIRDTIEEDGIKLVKLYFSPRNPNDLIFRGTMLITLDQRYSVQKINMTISKKANLNWTKQLRIRQEFEKGTDGRYHVALSNMIAEFALSKNAATSILGERTVSFKHFIVNQPAADSVYQGKPDQIANNP